MCKTDAKALHMSAENIPRSAKPFSLGLAPATEKAMSDLETPMPSPVAHRDKAVEAEVIELCIGSYGFLKHQYGELAATIIFAAVQQSAVRQ